MTKFRNEDLFLIVCKNDEGSPTAEVRTAYPEDILSVDENRSEWSFLHSSSSAPFGEMLVRSEDGYVYGIVNRSKPEHISGMATRILSIGWQFAADTYSDDRRMTPEDELRGLSFLHR